MAKENLIMNIKVFEKCKQIKNRRSGFFMVTQNRFQSWVLWVSVAALIGFVVKTYFGYEIPQFDTLINMILVILSGFGIVNNPENKIGL